MTSDIQTGGENRTANVADSRSTPPEITAKIEELLAQSLRYNRELLRIHRELNALRAQAADAEAERKRPAPDAPSE